MESDKFVQFFLDLANLRIKRHIQRVENSFSQQLVRRIRNAGRRRIAVADDDAAVLLMVDSNLQRENILPSERAFAYKMKLETLKNQGARSDLTSR